MLWEMQVSLGQCSYNVGCEARTVQNGSTLYSLHIDKNNFYFFDKL